MTTGGTQPYTPNPTKTLADRTRLLSALLLALLFVVPGTGALPGQSDTCDDVDVIINPDEPTSDERIHVSVHGVQGGEVHVEWTLTAASGQIVNAGATYREASDDHTYHLDPLGPYDRNHTFEAVATAEFPNEGRCNAAPSLQVPILNAPPTAVITQEPQTFYRGQEVTFTATDLYDADGDPIGLTWSKDGTPDTTGKSLTLTFHDLEPHTLELILDDGFDTTHIPHTTSAQNRLPTIHDAQLHPATVIRDQDVQLTWTMHDEDADQGYDTLTPSVRQGNHDPLPLDTPHFTTNFTTPGAHTLTARADDGHTHTEQTLTATVLDRTAPELPRTAAQAQYATLHIPTGTGAPTSEHAPPFLHHTWPAADAAELTKRLDWAATQDIEIVTIAGPLPPLTHTLETAVQNAHASGTTLVVPAPEHRPGAFQIQGLAALPEVITVAYGPDADTILTACGPAVDLTPKPDLGAPATSQQEALDHIRTLLAEYILRGVADPVLLRALAIGAAIAGDPFASGAGTVHAIQNETPLIPALPLSPYLDFGVVNDQKPQGTDVGVLNLNGLNTRLHEHYDRSLPGQNVTVHLDSEFHYLPDLIEQGFNALACDTPEVPTHRLTTPLTQQVPPATLDVAPLVPDLAPLVHATHDLYALMDPHLRENDFDHGLSLAQWDQLDLAAQALRDNRHGLEDANATQAIQRMDAIRNASQSVCTLIDTNEVCQQTDTVRETAAWLIDETNKGIQAIRSAVDTTTLDYTTDPARTAEAPRGLYLGYTTVTTTSTLDGETLEPQHAPLRIPTAMLLTGTTVVDVTYADDSPVVNTTVEASAKAATGTPVHPVDPVSNLFVTIPKGYHVTTNENGQATLDHLAPLMSLPGLAPNDRWHFGAYYDAPLELTAESGDERLPIMVEPVTDQPLYGPSMTLLARTVDRNSTQDIKTFILDNLDGVQPSESFQLARELLARDIDHQVPLEVPTGAYTRVVDHIDPTHWQTGSLDDGTLGTVDDLADELLGSSGGWTWTTEDDALYGVATHGQSAGIARYTFPLPDAEHLQLGLNVELGDNTRGLPFLIATMDETMTEQLDQLLAQTLAADATEPTDEQVVDTIHWFAAKNHMVRVLPLSEPAVAASHDDTQIGLYPNSVTGLGPKTTHALTTEFTLEGRATDNASLTLVVLPAPIGTLETPTTGTLAPSAPLGGEITMTSSIRLLSYTPLEADNDGTLRMDNPLATSHAEHWDTFLQVTKNSGIQLDTIAVNETPRATPPATSGVPLGFNPFALGWQKADQSDNTTVRGYALTEHRPVYITALPDEVTCWFNAAFSAKHYDRVNNPRPGGLCVILWLMGKVDVSFPNAIEDVHVEAGARAFIYNPFAIHYGETPAAGTLLRGADGLLTNINVTSYQSRWDPHPIEAAGANHDYIVLDRTLLQQAGDPLEFRHETNDHPDAAYPIAVSHWDHEPAPPQPLIEL